jgi:hypothetical protein
MKIPLDFFLTLIKNFLEQIGMDDISEELKKQITSDDDDYVYKNIYLLYNSYRKMSLLNCQFKMFIILLSHQTQQ